MNSTRNKLVENYLRYKRSRYFIPVILTLTLGLSFFYNLGGTPLFDRDEGAFTEATREMIERNDYISPYLNGEPRYDKPILIYWFQALSVSLFGLNEFGFRFPSALFASLWVLAVYLFARRELGAQTGLKAALMMATSLWVVVIGRTAIADALLNLLISMSMFSFYEYFKRSDKKFLYFTFFWASLGCLTKGPIAVAIPVSVSFLFMISMKRLKEWFSLIFNPYGVLIFLAVAVPWYAAQYLKEGQPFVDGFFFRHNVYRYTSTMEGHGGALFYYLPILLLILLPYSSLLIRTTTRVKDMLRDDLDRFLWFWFLFVLIFFSLSATKLPHYVLHGTPPLFILMGKYSDKLKSKFWAMLPALLFFILILLLPRIVRLIWDMVDVVYFKAQIEHAWYVFDAEYYIMAAFVLLGTVSLICFKKYPADVLLIFTGYLFTFLVVYVVWPTVGEVLQKPIKEAAAFASKHHLNLVMWNIDSPSFSVYRGKVTPWREPSDGEIAVTKITKLEDLKEYDVLFRDGGIVIVRVRKTSR